MQSPEYPIKVVTVDLKDPITDIEAAGYAGVQVFLRLNGAPVGYVRPPIINQRVQAAVLVEEILERYTETVLKQLQRNRLATPAQEEGSVRALFHVQPAPAEQCPLVTVAVCTRDRTDDLARCLEALGRLDYPNLEVVVVDNAPSSRATEDLVRSRFPEVRYILEEHPGLDWARNRAAVEARGEIIAYTDDDVIVDPLWVRALSQAFIDCPEAGGVTGLVVPYELETSAQVLFEMYGGFGRGCCRREYRSDRSGKIHWGFLGTGQFGTGANMAFRRSFFQKAGLFDPALDVGTVTNGGGDLEMFLRVLKSGHTLVYEPAALVFHRHRREYSELRRQLSNNGIGLYSYFCRTGREYPEERRNLFRLGVWWLFYRHIKRLCRSFVCGWRFPRDLILAELRGSLVGLCSYPRARRKAEQIVKRFGPAPELEATSLPPRECATWKRPGTAVRSVDLSQRVGNLSDIEEYTEVQVFLFWKTQPLGHLLLPNDCGTITSRQLIEAAVEYLGIRLFDPERRLDDYALYYALRAELSAFLHGRAPQPALPAEEERIAVLPPSVKVSIVVATYDRPDDLRGCLPHLLKQVTPREVEIIVVDNHPSSGLTPPVVEAFPGIRLVQERRQGLAYARNAGILAATGDIIVATDDDVRMPEDWLENLVAPFARADVMAVTGNVLPLELETLSQKHFETYGGLGRGYHARKFNDRWFDAYRRHAVPTWSLGATANAAFRSCIFGDPRIGLMDEVLGPGMPSGVGEDTYLFYRILKCGYTIEYEPAAWVWHRHRSDMDALKRQLYSYSKGHVAYHLNTAVRDGDFRSLLHVGYHLPKMHWQRIRRTLRRKGDYPLSLILLEMWGNIVGPFALLRSMFIVRRQGRSVATRSGKPADLAGARSNTEELTLH